MRLLFVTYCFPPYRTSGAVRTGQTAQELTRSRRGRPRHLGRPPGVGAKPRDDHASRARRVHPLARRQCGGHHPRQTGLPGGRLRGRQSQRSPEPLSPPPARHLLRLAQQNLVYMPDDWIGWYPWATRAAMRLTRHWRADLIYASAGPYTSLLVAATVARIRGIPWVGELRDLWTDNHYREFAPWLRPLDARLERCVLGSAAGLVTMSEPWAEQLERRYPVPVRVVYNGYDGRRTPVASGRRQDPARRTPRTS